MGRLQRKPPPLRGRICRNGTDPDLPAYYSTPSTSTASTGGSRRAKCVRWITGTSSGAFRPSFLCSLMNVRTQLTRNSSQGMGVAKVRQVEPSTLLAVRFYALPRRSGLIHLLPTDGPPIPRAACAYRMTIVCASAGRHPRRYRRGHAGPTLFP